SSELGYRRQHGKSTDEFGDESELEQVLGQDVGVEVLFVVLRLQQGTEADSVLALACGDDLLHPGEGAGDDEEHVRGVDLQEVLVRVLASALRWDRGLSALEDLQQ